jgi:hypothetical protein
MERISKREELADSRFLQEAEQKARLASIADSEKHRPIAAAPAAQGAQERQTDDAEAAPAIQALALPAAPAPQTWRNSNSASYVGAGTSLAAPRGLIAESSAAASKKIAAAAGAKDAAALTFGTSRRYVDASGSNVTGTLDATSNSVSMSRDDTSAAQVDALTSTSEDPIVMLSPFEVKASNDQGYQATNSLAGSRIATAVTLSAPPLELNLSAAASPGSAGSSRTARAKVSEAANSEQKGAFLKMSSAAADQPVVHAPAAAKPETRASTTTKVNAVSTFSLHVSDVSYQLARAALARGQKPAPDTIRPEEFYNAFDYGDAAPASGEPIGCRIEQARHPFLQERNLVRIALRVPSTGRDAAQPLHLTLLVDTSGSMEREDRHATLQRALDVLASLLGPNDRVTVIGFARQPRLLADAVPGDQVKIAAQLLDGTPAEGGTNLDAALALAGEKARGHLDRAAQNRIVVLTDGAANLGNDNPEKLGEQVAALRRDGISFDACGIGLDGLDDLVLEALTRKGNGRYYVINSPEQADAGFARKLAGALHPAAQNAKVQVRFNPSRVTSYRLIGFEQHRLREEDFRNDQVTAAELASDESAVAMYEVQVNSEGEGDLGNVFVRFRNATGATVERSWPLLLEPQAPAFDHATPSLQLAGLAALVAQKLQGDPISSQFRLNELTPVSNRLRSAYRGDPRVLDFVSMFQQAQKLLRD